MASSFGTRGFTLLEVLVVLAITSMLSLLLMDGVGQVLLIEQRMGERTREFREVQLQQYWVRQLIAGARASRDYPFEMSDTRLRGLTLAPLAGEPGLPTLFELSLVSLEGATELRYREDDGVEFTLMAFDGRELVSPPRFLVIDAEGTYRNRWRSKEGEPQWPPGLALSVPRVDGEDFWHLAVIGRRMPRIKLDENIGI